MSATTDPIPVRALNQVTYCPRLYYLQYVDAVVPVNEHVEGGLFDHRRVDSAELKNKTRKDGDTSTSRGITLSSDKLGISGVLDMIEEKTGEQYPVETKHGSAPRDDDGNPTTWDNDAVQLCAQALLVEEAYGKPVPRGFQFYVGTHGFEAVAALKQVVEPAELGEGRRAGSRSGNCHPKRLPEDRLMHDSDTVLTGLLSLS